MSRVDPLDSLKSFEPKTTTEQKAKQSNAEVEEMANQHGFVGRQVTPLNVPVDRSKRRHKTGRNVQINIKGEQETLDRFYAAVDAMGCGVGEAFEVAVDLLETKISES